MRRPARVRFWTGPDWSREDQWIAVLQLFPSPHLMGRHEEGRLVLVGLEVELAYRWPWGRRHRQWRYWGDDMDGWRKPFKFWVRSDANEIAWRLAEAQGWEREA